MLLGSFVIIGTNGFVSTSRAHIHTFSFSDILSTTTRHASVDKAPSLYNSNKKNSSDEKKSRRRRWKNVLDPKNQEKYLREPPENRTVTNLAMISVVALMTTAFFAIIVASGPGAWRYYLAGGICAATSHSVPVPIDVVKTRMQVDANLYRKSFWEASQRIVKQDGAGALLAGLGPTTLGYMLEGAVKFGVYEVLKSPITSILTAGAAATSMGFICSKLFAYAICAAVSGLCAAIMLCPMEAIRIRMVAEPDFADNWISCGVKMVQTEGVNGLSKGMPPMIYKQVPYTVTKNVSFDLLTRSAYAALRNCGVAISSTVTMTVPTLAAVVASILSCISSQPGDMLLSLVNAHTGTRTSRDIIRDIRKTDRGLKGLFVGMKTRLLHVGIIVTVQLLIYDYVKRLCGIAATGL